MQKRNAAFYFQLFLSMFKLSAFTLGGGYVIVPLMRKCFVQKLCWLQEEEMLNYTAIAQSSPGAIAVNASLLVGFRLAGFPGAMVALLGTVLPPLILLSVISVAYTAFIHNALIQHILRGMGAGVCALILDVVIDMSTVILHKKKLTAVILMLAAFVAVAVLHVNAVYVILSGAVIGVLRGLRWKARGSAE